MNPKKKLHASLRLALGSGDPQKVQALVAAGANLHYSHDGGYTALLDSVHGRDVFHDSRLVELLQLLLAHGVDLNSVTRYQESGLRVLSNLARFDAVSLLLSAGADEGQLEWTPLIKTVALGTLADMEALLATGAPLEARDRWSRTAWLVAVNIGDVAKAKVLRQHGADTRARGRCGKPPLFYAIERHHTPMLQWLLEIGLDHEEPDDFGATPLMHAAECGHAEGLDLLRQAGAAIDREHNGDTALSVAASREMLLRLLDAGADPRHLTHEKQRMLLGLDPEPSDDPLAHVSESQFLRARTRRFGARNPETMDEPFWHGMIRAGVTGYGATQRFKGPSSFGATPVWCAQRFGQSMTILPDGRIVQIGGEHEDYYDPDFCIYNDVFVHEPDGTIHVHGYPESVFPPTDFHTATLMDGAIYVIGCLGYSAHRLQGHTPVYRLDTRTFRFARVETHGTEPGWIHEHRANRCSPHEIRVSGGRILALEGHVEVESDNTRAFILDIKQLAWREDGQ